MRLNRIIASLVPYGSVVHTADALYVTKYRPGTQKINLSPSSCILLPIFVLLTIEPNNIGLFETIFCRTGYEVSIVAIDLSGLTLH